MMIQHMSHARLVGQYDANNTYQYVVNRDDVQLSWLAKAITELGGAEPAPAATPTESIASGPARSTPCSIRTRGRRRRWSNAGGRASKP